MENLNSENKLFLLVAEAINERDSGLILDVLNSVECSVYPSDEKEAIRAMLVAASNAISILDSHSL